ncbi:gastrula zinc finger protein xFG20-1-like isoform X2 [Thalassophryne amazonica]|uniref:gastrula zinc finger protein xFG20-1-like isoform X2 n=1 Tax=Thalassophryne amazonica TaxID=390379 RepID=UPI001471E3D2|nr:gastrula zinc finger protein xFG20-1-like isoform X2 [Thalassophryne amazonica]
MPKSCCIVGCTNNSAKREDLSFYMIPSEATEPERREKWLQVIGRRANPGSTELWRPKSDYHYVCSSHFTGKKNNSPAHPDYVPSIFPQIAVGDSNGNQHNHFKRAQKRKIQTSATVSTNRANTKRRQGSGDTTTKSEESPSRDSSLPRVHVETDVQQLFVREDAILPEEQEWSHILHENDLNPPNIKEEQEQVWISQEGELRHQLEDNDITFPFTDVPVKRENNEEDSHLSHYQSQTNKNTLEPIVKSPTEDVKIEADGDTYGGSELSSNCDPYCHLEVQTNNKTLDCSDTETDDSWDWKETGDQPGFNKKQLSCCKCGKAFGRMNNLRVHVRIHSGEKPFSCTECSKRFVQKGALKRHMRSHTGEKPFSCCDCGKTFGFMNLREHKRIHSGEKPFNCTECGKRFMQKGNLKNHMRIHIGCPECDKRFGRKGDLKRHMRIHTEETLSLL